jgi:hypothetical protein
VSGAHTYSEEGRYEVDVVVTDFNDDLGAGLTIAHVGRSGQAPPSALGQVASDFSHSQEYFTDLVTATYQHYLGRGPDAGGLSFWVNAMLKGTTTDELLEISFISSPEFISDNGGLGAGWVTSMYDKLLGRDPDQGGLNYWVGQLNSGTSPATIALGFAASPEREGQRVTNDYLLYLGRAPGASEVSYWVNAFTNGLSNESVVAGFVGSPEYFEDHFDNAVDWLYSAYQAILGRAPDENGLQSWLNLLDNS